MAILCSSMTSAKPVLIGLVERWIQLKAHDIREAIKLGGGWEEWAQVDFALFIQDHYDDRPLSNVSVSRKRPMISTNEQIKADIVIKQKEAFSIIELKCQTSHEEGTICLFKRFQSYADNFTVLGQHVSPGNILMIAITTAPETAEIVESMSRGERAEKQLDFLNAAVIGEPIYIIWGRPSTMFQMSQ